MRIYQIIRKSLSTVLSASLIFGHSFVTHGAEEKMSLITSSDNESIGVSAALSDDRKYLQMKFFKCKTQEQCEDMFQQATINLTQLARSLKAVEKAIKNGENLKYACHAFGAIAVGALFFVAVSTPVAIGVLATAGFQLTIPKIWEACYGVLDSTTSQTTMGALLNDLGNSQVTETEGNFRFEGSRDELISLIHKAITNKWISVQVLPLP